MKLIKSFNMKTRKTVAIAAAMAMVVIIPTAQAQTSSPTSSLGSLLDGGSLTIGDKTFSGFGWIASGADPSVVSALNTDAAGLIVTASSVGDVYYLDFAGLIAVNNLGGNGTLFGDLQLSYTVTVNSGPAVIDWIDQQYTPNGLPVPGNQIIIGETAVGATASANSTLTLNPTDLIDPAPEAGDNLFLVPGQTQLAVVKDILIVAAPGQLLGLSDVEQSFHQVPEPASVGCFLLGFGTLIFTRRFRQNKRV